MSEELWIAFGTNTVVLVLAFIAGSIRMTQLIGDIKTEVVTLISDKEAERNKEFSKVWSEFVTVRHELYKTTHDFGETIMALKQKIADIELNAANNYVRRDSFGEAIKQVVESMAALRAEIRTDLQRMEHKIDAKNA